MKRMTDTCENITFPSTLLSDGKTKEYTTQKKPEELFEFSDLTTHATRDKIVKDSWGFSNGKGRTVWRYVC